MLTNGQVVSTTDDSSVPSALLKELDVITSELSEDSNVMRELRHHDGHKWASGYDLGALLDHREDLCAALPRLLCGSVGTLGIVLSAEFGAEVLPPERFAVQLGFTNEVDACHAALMLRDAAEAVEFLSRESLELLREYNDTLDDHESEALLVAEFRNNERGIALTRITEIARRFTLTGKPCMAYESTEIEAIWKARKSLLPTIRRVCSERNLTAPSIVNDVGVPPDRLPELLSAVRSIFAKHSITAAIYGHAGSGNLHLRPLLREPSAPFLFELATEVYKSVTALGGFITAEHGLGPLRAPFLKMEWSASARRYMHRVKLAFDPDLILNPGSAIDDGDDQSGWTLPVRM
jgi:FAD/FMN-containing dehydrogenase